jgi:hypothetical protein
MTKTKQIKNKGLSYREGLKRISKMQDEGKISMSAYLEFMRIMGEVSTNQYANGIDDGVELGKKMRY